MINIGRYIQMKNPYVLTRKDLLSMIDPFYEAFVLCKFDNFISFRLSSILRGDYDV